MPAARVGDFVFAHFGIDFVTRMLSILRAIIVAVASFVLHGCESPDVYTPTHAFSDKGRVGWRCEFKSISYPAVARRQGQQGTVTLRITVDDKGSIVSTEIAASSGWPLLDAAAIEAASRAVCPPFADPVRGFAAKVTFRQPLGFYLDEPSPVWRRPAMPGSL